MIKEGIISDASTPCPKTGHMCSCTHSKEFCYETEDAAKYASLKELGEAFTKESISND